MPLAVQVDPGGVAAQVAARRPVDVDHRDQVHGRRLQQARADRVGRVQQAVQRPFHPPAGHGLAGVLAAHHPYGARAVAKSNAVDRAAVDRPSDLVDRYAGGGGGAVQQAPMAGQVVGREEGEPDGVGAGRAADLQHAVGEAGLGAGPGLVVGADAGAVARPAARIGRGPGVDDAQDQRLALGAAHPEIEPLEPRTVGIRSDPQVGRGLAHAVHQDVAAVEIGVDLQGHLIFPLVPGARKT
jgi:hypothetical protein